METAPEDDERPAPRPHLPQFVAESVVPWLRFVGTVRLLGGLGVALLLAGVAWWMLRAPAAPTETRLPLAGRAAAAQSVVGNTSSSRPSLPPTTVVAAVVVHVTGAVRTPGVYELVAGQRVADAILAAGGALADADPNALNLAAPVADGDRIAVPTAGEAAGPSGHSHAASSPDDADVVGPLDVNTATAAELETLPGIGPATAAAIVEHRQRNGPFAAVDDLEAVPGIGTAKLDAVRDLVRV